MGTFWGLPPSPVRLLIFPGHWYGVGDTLQLHLMVREEHIPDTQRHIALEVTDFEETMRHLKENSIEIIDGPGKRTDGSDYLFCKDPDGNRGGKSQNTERPGTTSRFPCAGTFRADTGVCPISATLFCTNLRSFLGS